MTKFWCENNQYISLFTYNIILLEDFEYHREIENIIFRVIATLW